MPTGSLKGKADGGSFKVTFDTITGPASYTAPFTYTTPLSNLVSAHVSIVNNPGDKLVTYSLSGSSILISFYTISSNTATGAITATADANGTNESSLTLSIAAFGY